MNLSSNQITNFLLFGIFLLLAVDVFSPRQAAQRSIDPQQRQLSQMGRSPGMGGHGEVKDMGNPHTGDNGFSFENMVFAALKCPSDPVLTLSDLSCTGSEAEKRKQVVQELSSQNLPPRLLFDRVIDEFGEGALTDQALEIRRANRG
ncbi:MAG: hypothetical protein KDD52_00375 [Bdellovibrionales bacterium]|nr:hypothetical protein [Bdellovibrionales bacterium]